MARNSLFKALDLNHKPKRNGFDRSFNHKWTSKAGLCYPCMHMTTLPSGKYRLRVDHTTTTPPLNTAANVQITEYFDFFFVPYRVLFRDSNNILTNNQQNAVLASNPYSNKKVGVDMPYFHHGDYFRIRMWSDSSASNPPSYLTMLAQKQDAFGFNRGALSAQLMSMLGYGSVTYDEFENYFVGDGSLSSGASTLFVGQSKVSALPLLAYQKIYYDFFRNTQWEDNQPYNYNVDYLGESASIYLNTSDPSVYGDYWDNHTMFDMYYSNYPRDLFFGVLPESQFGDAAVVDSSLDAGDTVLPTAIPNRYYQRLGTMPVGIDGAGYPETTVEKLNNEDQNDNFYIHPHIPDDISSSSSPLNNTYLRGDMREYTNALLSSLSSSFDILELRKAQFLQKYKEIIGTGDYTYQDRIRKIFGINVPDYQGEMCRYLGGFSSGIGVNPVINNNVSGNNDATIKGTSIGRNTSKVIEFEAKEHGIIMCIYHCAPKIDYMLDAYHFDVTKTSSDDFANPIFDQLGFQELPLQYLNIRRSTSPLANTAETHLGYTTRYFDYKTNIDQTSGAWRESLLTEGWLAPLDFDYLQNFVFTQEGVSGNNEKFALNSNFFKVNPRILDDIYSVKASDDWNTDQFRVNANFSIHCVLPLDYNGVPY